MAVGIEYRDSITFRSRWSYMYVYVCSLFVGRGRLYSQPSKSAHADILVSWNPSEALAILFGAQLWYAWSPNCRVPSTNWMVALRGRMTVRSRYEVAGRVSQPEDSAAFRLTNPVSTIRALHVCNVASNEYDVMTSICEGTEYGNKLISPRDARITNVYPYVKLRKCLHNAIHAPTPPHRNPKPSVHSPLPVFLETISTDKFVFLPIPSQPFTHTQNQKSPILTSTHSTRPTDLQPAPHCHHLAAAAAVAGSFWDH
jgi:hypothetical protein